MKLDGIAPDSLGTTALPSKAVSLAAAKSFERTVAIVTIVTPFIGGVVGILALWGRWVGWPELALCLSLSFLTMLGITMGFHRLFTHRSFVTTTPVRVFLGIAGSMAAQGPILFWVACHRRHHKYSDEVDDPHSPNQSRGDWFAVLRGWWHGHVGWMFSHQPENYFRLVPDLLRDKISYRLNRAYFLWVALGLLLPAAAGFAMYHTWIGAARGLLWGGLIRVFLVHHTTWSVNSACHLFGSQPFRTGDHSRNNGLCAILTFGEGWHNNHHAFPASARHGLTFWELDLVYFFIRMLSLAGLATQVRLPDPASMARKRKTLISDPAGIISADGQIQGVSP